MECVDTQGSPPHTRGKVELIHWHLRKVRITPAHAGKRVLPLPVLRANGDHPRTRGEKQEPAERHPGRGGSPPHTRGKVTGIIDTIPELGITPAHAGKSTPQPCQTAHRQDHPRTRGEKKDMTYTQWEKWGSPPHTRGKDFYSGRKWRPWGITPAHAGKSYSRPTIAAKWWDHPRTRGEKTKRIPILSHCFQVKGSFSFSFS